MSGEMKASELLKVIKNALPRDPERVTVGELLEAVKVAGAAARHSASRLVVEVKVKKGWHDGGLEGYQVGAPVHVGGQVWVPVVLDNEEDPTFCKASSLEGWIE